MIPRNTRLRPRLKTDSEVEVTGYMPSVQKYVVCPVEFGPNKAFSVSEIAEHYDCSGYDLEIVELDDISAWKRMSTEIWTKATKPTPPEPKPSPEEVFAAQAKS
jgi:hypothetical protein